eukprot:Rmarinus@m.28936
MPRGLLILILLHQLLFIAGTSSSGFGSGCGEGSASSPAPSSSAESSVIGSSASGSTVTEPETSVSECDSEPYTPSGSTSDSPFGSASPPENTLVSESEADSLSETTLPLESGTGSVLGSATLSAVTESESASPSASAESETGSPFGSTSPSANTEYETAFGSVSPSGSTFADDTDATSHPLSTDPTSSPSAHSESTMTTSVDSLLSSADNSTEVDDSPSNPSDIDETTELEAGSPFGSVSQPANSSVVTGVPPQSPTTSFEPPSTTYTISSESAVATSAMGSTMPSTYESTEVEVSVQSSQVSTAEETDLASFTMVSQPAGSALSQVPSISDSPSVMSNGSSGVQPSISLPSPSGSTPPRSSVTMSITNSDPPSYTMPISSGSSALMQPSITLPGTTGSTSSLSSVTMSHSPPMSSSTNLPSYTLPSDPLGSSPHAPSLTLPGSDGTGPASFSMSQSLDSDISNIPSLSLPDSSGGLPYSVPSLTASEIRTSDLITHMNDTGVYPGTIASGSHSAFSSDTVQLSTSDTNFSPSEPPSGSALPDPSVTIVESTTSSGVFSEAPGSGSQVLPSVSISNPQLSSNSAALPSVSHKTSSPSHSSGTSMSVSIVDSTSSTTSSSTQRSPLPPSSGNPLSTSTNPPVGITSGFGSSPLDSSWSDFFSSGSMSGSVLVPPPLTDSDSFGFPSGSLPPMTLTFSHPLTDSESDRPSTPHSVSGVGSTISSSRPSLTTGSGHTSGTRPSESLPSLTIQTSSPEPTGSTSLFSSPEGSSVHGSTGVPSLTLGSSSGVTSQPTVTIGSSLSSPIGSVVPSLTFSANSTSPSGSAVPSLSVGSGSQSTIGSPSLTVPPGSGSDTSTTAGGSGSPLTSITVTTGSSLPVGSASGQLPSLTLTNGSATGASGGTSYPPMSGSGPILTSGIPPPLTIGSGLSISTSETVVQSSLGSTTGSANGSPMGSSTTPSTTSTETSATSVSGTSFPSLTVTGHGSGSSGVGDRPPLTIDTTSDSDFETGSESLSDSMPFTLTTTTNSPATPPSVPIPTTQTTTTTVSFSTTSMLTTTHSGTCGDCVHGVCSATGGGLCACEPGWTGDLCDEPECDPEGDGISCSGHGTCVAPGVCECDEGWQLDTCGESIDECADNPCDHGTCVDGHLEFSCVCETGYSGSLCTIPDCSNFADCSEHGTCVAPDTCACDCDASGANCYTGVDCGVPDCELRNDCSGHGYCSEPNVCTCDDGYNGNSCELLRCPNDCSSHGRLDIISAGVYGCNGLTGECTCRSGYTGTNCSEVDSGAQRTCPFDCSGYVGACEKPAYTCNCPDGTFGVGCQYFHCPGESDDCSQSSADECPSYCSGQGSCKTDVGACKCKGLAFGSDCASLDCVDSTCGGKGDCDYSVGECVCDDGYYGDSCEFVYCPASGGVECTGRGVCDSDVGECTCDEGFMGDACEFVSCPEDCNGHGNPMVRTYGVNGCDGVSGECTCFNSWVTVNGTLYFASYSGESCDQLECLSMYQGFECSSNGVCDHSTDPYPTCKCDSLGGVPLFTGPACEAANPDAVPEGEDVEAVSAALPITIPLDQITDDVIDAMIRGMAIALGLDPETIKLASSPSGRRADDSFVFEIQFVTDQSGGGYASGVDLTSAITSNADVVGSSVEETVANDTAVALVVDSSAIATAIPCPASCSGQGVCDTATGVCDCDDGYREDVDAACRIPECYDAELLVSAHALNGDGIFSGCWNRGLCEGPNECSCYQGYSGDRCEIESCPLDASNSTCSNHGDCHVTSTCTCDWSLEYSDDTCVDAAEENDWCRDLAALGACAGKVDGVDYSEYMQSECSMTCHLTLMAEIGSSNTGYCSSAFSPDVEYLYSGSTCATPSCGGCSGRGTCFVPNVCTCDTGYVGDQCETVECIETGDGEYCNGHGSCSRPNVCTCDEGYLGDTCAVVDCTPCPDDGYYTCPGEPPLEDENGNALYPERCECKSGWTGDNCDEPLCWDHECNGRGECSLPYECTCTDQLYTGVECQYLKECITGDAGPCSGNGGCYVPNECTCFDGYYGDECQHINCTAVNDCSDQGTCIAPDTCACDSVDGTPLYQGVDCSEPYCTPGSNGIACSGHGTCTQPAECVCDEGWTTADSIDDPALMCLDAVCTDNCNGRGLCVAPDVCECYVDRFDAATSCASCSPGWTGDTCEEMEDPCLRVDCGNHGSCVSSGQVYWCDCDDGYSGDTCDIDLCSPDPCLNGTCTHGPAEGFTCLCLDGFSGDMCEVDACAGAICGAGQCDRQPDGGFSCDCPEGSWGTYCEETPCTAAPCLNYGVCHVDLDVPVQYTCECGSGYSGPTCATDICAYVHCEEGEVCLRTSGFDLSTRYERTTKNAASWCEPVSVCQPDSSGEDDACGDNANCELVGGVSTECVCVDSWFGPDCDQEDEISHILLYITVAVPTETGLTDVDLIYMKQGLRELLHVTLNEVVLQTATARRAAVDASTSTSTSPPRLVLADAPAMADTTHWDSSGVEVDNGESNTSSRNGGLSSHDDGGVDGDLTRVDGDYAGSQSMYDTANGDGAFRGSDSPNFARRVDSPNTSSTSCVFMVYPPSSATTQAEVDAFVADGVASLGEISEETLSVYLQVEVEALENVEGVAGASYTDSGGGAQSDSAGGGGDGVDETGAIIGSVTGAVAALVVVVALHIYRSKNRPRATVKNDPGSDEEDPKATVFGEPPIDDNEAPSSNKLISPDHEDSENSNGSNKSGDRRRSRHRHVGEKVGSGSGGSDEDDAHPRRHGKRDPRRQKGSRKSSPRLGSENERQLTAGSEPESSGREEGELVVGESPRRHGKRKRRFVDPRAPSALRESDYLAQFHDYVDQQVPMVDLKSSAEKSLDADPTVDVRERGLQEEAKTAGGDRGGMDDFQSESFVERSRSRRWKNKAKYGVDYNDGGDGADAPIVDLGIELDIREPEVMHASNSATMLHSNERLSGSTRRTRRFGARSAHTSPRADEDRNAQSPPRLSPRLHRDLAATNPHTDNLGKSERSWRRYRKPKGTEHLEPEFATGDVDARTQGRGRGIQDPQAEVYKGGRGARGSADAQLEECVGNATREKGQESEASSLRPVHRSRVDSEITNLLLNGSFDDASFGSDGGEGPRWESFGTSAQNGESARSSSSYRTHASEPFVG